MTIGVYLVNPATVTGIYAGGELATFPPVLDRA